MKTLTVTFHHSTNYGAILQTYALQQKILSLGHDNIVLEYPYSETSLCKVSWCNPKSIARVLYLRCFQLLRGKRLKTLKKSFVDFHKKHIKLTRIFLDMDDLRANVPQVDCLVTGSDQVWNFTTNTSFIPSRFLDFGDSRWIRFSYGASLEKLNYTDVQKDYVKQKLSAFKGISLREESAKTYIESITGYKCFTVLDPVFLLSKKEWCELAKEPRIEGAYILCYQVLGNKRMQEVVDKVKADTGLPVVSICNGVVKWIRADYTFFDVSPEEFIGFYKNAKIVVTTSFHGTALGIIFNKPVYSLVKPGFANRIKDVMQLFDLNDFVIDAKVLVPNVNADISKQEIILEREREKSIDYLKQMLDEN